MKRKSILYRLWGVILCFTLGSTSVYAQKEAPDFVPASAHDPSVQSPQLAAIIRHDNLPVNMNTGGINLEIPLVNWKDRDFDCPISLSYNSAGFRPREQDNYVGRNWMLNVGGVIYRKVNGVPDDMEDFQPNMAAETNTYNRVCGFLNVYSRNMFSKEEMLRNYRNNPYKYAKYKDQYACMPIIPNLNKDVETSADVFYFSFGKHSGKFMINFDGSVSVSGNNGGKYKVDLSDMKLFNNTNPRETHIRIYTDDGYVYTFGGGGYSSLEYNALAWKDYFYNGHMNPDYYHNEITAYYLTEILSPNGRKITFTYKDGIDKQYHTIPQNLQNLKNDNLQPVAQETALYYSLSCASRFQSYKIAPVNVNLNNKAVKPEPYSFYALTKVVLLEQITTDNCTIKFHYSGRDKHIDYGVSDIYKDQFPYICGAKLDEIELFSSDTEKTKFAYTYQCGNRMFLQSVNTQEGKYEFQYKTGDIADIPNMLTYNIDHWGFWRGIQKNEGIIPAMKLGELYDQDYIITSNDRDATGENYDYTLLQKVTYPTGGYSTFEYEPHLYSRMPMQSPSTNYYTGLGYPYGKQEELAGGARIRSVTHYEHNNTAKKTVYTYGYRAFTGELTYMPYYKYLAFKKQEKADGDYISAIGFDSEGVTDISYPSVHIRYPQVTEHYVNPATGSLSEEHPYKTTDFIAYLGSTTNYQDDFSYATAPEVFPLNPDIYFIYDDTRNYNRNLLAHPTVNVSLKYGKVQKECLYNAKGELVSQTEYEYKYLNKDKYSFRIYTPGIHFGMRTGLYSHIIKEPFYEYALTKKKSTLYAPGNNLKGMENNQWFAYDKDGYLSQSSTLKNNGDSLIDSYIRNESSSPSRIQMLPIEHSVRLANANGSRLLQRDTILFERRFAMNYEGMWSTPKKIISYDGNNSLQSTKEFIRRDNYGNPIEIRTNDSEHAIYLWGYYGQHLVAQIKNATYEEVTKALNMSPESLSEQYSPIVILSELQRKLPNAQVYTYTYHPLAGINSETAPNGHTTRYYYDSKRRLVKTYRTGENGKTEILQLNNYHIINE